MTTQIERGMEFLGWPISKLRALLKSYMHVKFGLFEFSKLSGVRLKPGAVAALLGEAYLRGLVGLVDEECDPVDDGRFGLTRSGLAIAAATARKRVPKDRAEVVLKSILARADALSQDRNAPIVVSKIWLFGSYIDPTKADVGDLDIVIETKRTNVPGTGEVIERLNYIREKYPGLMPSNFDPIFGNMDGYFVARQLYGPRRPAIVAPNDMITLRHLGCPCALFFDLERGGSIQPEYHPRHPDSPGRANHVREKLAMPELPPMLEFALTPAVVVTNAFVSRGRMPALEVSGSRSGDVIEEKAVVGRSTKDGLLKFERKVTLGASEWMYEIKIGLSRSRKKVGSSGPVLVELDVGDIFELVHADLIRLAAFRHERAGMQAIHAEVTISSAAIQTVDPYDMLRYTWPFDEHPTMELAGLPNDWGWGIGLLVNGEGARFVNPDEVDDDEDWQDFSFPFSREEYSRWNASLRS